MQQAECDFVINFRRRNRNKMQDEEIAGNDIIMIPLTPVKPLVTNGVKNRGIPFFMSINIDIYIKKNLSNLTHVDTYIFVWWVHIQ